ncbi:hypothetical protein MSG28_013515 [Choristoneura fumiferana]|uniref:Uncharacterized protein n=1 Tax=Choristoneura fumiferana TaxID=7141 RepID=A0ACC0K7S2_CHOFU|nr:hypothetical protein MSG28_013515 [Choristoneura fumiferana]
MKSRTKASCLASSGEPTGNRHRRSAGVFLSISGERPSDKNVPNAGPLLPVQLPIQLGGQGGVTLPVLVLPVPVYTKAPDTCNAHHNNEQTEVNEGVYPLPPQVQSATYVANRQQFTETTPPSVQKSAQQHNNLEQFKQQFFDAEPNDQVNVQRPVKGLPPFFNTGSQQDNQKPVRNFLSQIPKITEVVPPRGSLNFNLGAGGSKVSFGVEAPGSLQVSPGRAPNVNLGVQVSAPALEDAIPFSAGLFDQLFHTSAEMVQSFQRQVPQAPELPAVLIPDRSLPDRIPVVPEEPSGSAPIPAAAPPRPRFDRSLQLRIDLNVPHADYTEAFQTQWHAGSRTARTVVEDGGTTFYQAPLSDGRVQFLEVRVDRTGDKVVRRCTLSPLMPGSTKDQTFPGLPDVDGFEFAGYTSAEGQSQVERWHRVVAGGPGEGGAARGESLTFHHELLVTRNNGASVPLRYSVVTDSSVLGPACDAYTHRYRQLAGPADAVLPDTSKECDVFDDLPEPAANDKHAFAEIAARFKPLLEFSLPMRDTRYDFALDKFKVDFQRNYLDEAEEAVRKNILTQKSRFVAAGNRLADTFELAVNFLADRLDDEIEKLLGVIQPKEGTEEPGLVPFPYSDNEVKDISNKLPDEFDWRPRGAVSPVRFQGTTCSSCWAFAVAGATEGALFKKTNRLVPLSPQCLVDCGKPYGTNGCNGTWPSFAYDYVQGRGLPAWDEYTEYEAKVLECKDRSVPPVTHISGHVNVTANSVSALKVAIRKHAPNVVIVDGRADSFVLYKKGVLKDKRCGLTKPALNHAVLAVGWGNKDGPHFILKNSWTAKWGEEGYIRVDPSVCALLQRPSYPLIEQPNIDREELRAAAASVSNSNDQD